MGILGEQSILTQLGAYINEGYMFEDYSFVPVSDGYDAESNISFIVNDGDNRLASVKIVKIDGEPVDAVADTYDYTDVYADVTSEFEDKADEYDTESVKKWILGKLASMGFDKNLAKYDDEEYDVDNYKEDELGEPDEFDDVKDIDGETQFSLSDIEDDEEV